MDITADGMDDNNYKELRHLFNRLNERLDRIEGALIGDEAIGQDGIGKRVRRLEIEMEKLDKRFAKILWMVTGASAGATGLVQMLTKGMF